MIKYKADCYWQSTITEKDIIRETDKCVFYLNRNGQEDRELKESDHSKWFDTKEQAIEYNRAYLIRRVQQAKIDLSHREAKLEAFNNEFPVL